MVATFWICRSRFFDAPSEYFSDQIMSIFQVHICILVMEARMQIELYYAMKAIREYRESE